MHIRRGWTQVSMGSMANKTTNENVANQLNSTTTKPTIDINAIGQLDGTSILDVDLDSFEEKPWKKPGADITDYFNYGFHEYTWHLYCQKQKSIREEFHLQKKINVFCFRTNFDCINDGFRFWKMAVGCQRVCHLCLSFLEIDLNFLTGFRLCHQEWCVLRPECQCLHSHQDFGRLVIFLFLLSCFPKCLLQISPQLPNLNRPQ